MMYGWDTRFKGKNPEQMAAQVVGSLCLRADDRILRELQSEITAAIKYAIANDVPIEAATGNSALVFLED